MTIVTFVSIWLGLGLTGAVLDLRSKARFERALCRKYPTGHQPQPLSLSDWLWSIAYIPCGPSAILGATVWSIRSSLVGEPCWSDAR
jgi:hypothetical protein